MSAKEAKIDCLSAPTLQVIAARKIATDLLSQCIKDNEEPDYADRVNQFLEHASQLVTRSEEWSINQAEATMALTVMATKLFADFMAFSDANEQEGAE